MLTSAWYFEDAAAVQRLRKECAEWRSTPFHFGSRAKGRGGGTDCVGFVEAVMQAIGAAPQFTFKREPQDNSRHVYNQKVLKYFRGELEDPQSNILAQRFAEIPVPVIAAPEKNRRPSDAAMFAPQIDLGLMAGDIVLFKTGKELWHMGIMQDSTAFMHCAWPGGVTEANTNDTTYRGNLFTAFRARAIPITSP
jgi:cell wall-associated NlpC family hydrolase